MSRRSGRFRCGILPASAAFSFQYFQRRLLDHEQRRTAVLKRIRAFNLSPEPEVNITVPGPNFACRTCVPILSGGSGASASFGGAAFTPGRRCAC